MNNFSQHVSQIAFTYLVQHPFAFTYRYKPMYSLTLLPIFSRSQLANLFSINSFFRCPLKIKDENRSDMRLCTFHLSVCDTRDRRAGVEYGLEWKQ